ncbi:MAG TPA: adenosylmethionine--8-amino-7-oxononanoate transaminase [Candidatus Acidoferrales bacterium]|nr:adenosylmethionine--8-amino-7-oxononanoate transaminase [Candidatus Acidoferrales bacterium]
MSASDLHLWHPFTQEGIDPAPLVVRGGKGVFIEMQDGRQILDAISSWWVNLHGHSHPAIAQAVAEQAAKLEHVLFAGFSHEPAEELAFRLGKVIPAPLRHVFFSDDGSTAVEVALKLALQYWKNCGRLKKSRIVALENAYHGDTVGAMSVSDDSPFTAAFDSLRIPVLRTHSASCAHCPVGLTRSTCHIECLNKLESLLNEQGEEIAVVIVEPLLQGAGGMIVHPEEFLAGVRRLTEAHNVLLIADEVLTGFGRTGRMFACERAAVVPDLMCVAKGLTGGFLPLAATFATDRIHDAFVGGDRMRSFFHGHSYTANPIACAAANASLQIFEHEPVFERIAAIEKGHTERLPAFAAHPGVADVRHIGTVAAIELKVPDAGYLSSLRPRLYQYFLSRGVLLRPLGNVVYILPPYVITPEQLNFVYDVIRDSLALISSTK